MVGMLTPVLLPVRAAQFWCANKCQIRPEKNGESELYRRKHLPKEMYIAKVLFGSGKEVFLLYLNTEFL